MNGLEKKIIRNLTSPFKKYKKLVNETDVPNVILRDGHLIPSIGLGTWFPNESDVKNAVGKAINIGYSLIDVHLGSEISVGHAMEKAFAQRTVARENLYIIAKLDNKYYTDDEIIGALKETLKKLKLEKINLYLMYFPAPHEPHRASSYIMDTWIAMEKCVELGLTDSIGVSNFNMIQLSSLYDKARIKPVALQIEAHICLVPRVIRDYCREHCIVVIAHSPFGVVKSPDQRPSVAEHRNTSLDSIEVNEIANLYNRSKHQIALRYLIQLGMIPIPSSKTTKHLEENLKVFDFELSEKNIKKLLKLDTHLRTCFWNDYIGKPNYPYPRNEDEDIQSRQYNDTKKRYVPKFYDYIHTLKLFKKRKYERQVNENDVPSEVVGKGKVTSPAPSNVYEPVGQGAIRRRSTSQRINDPGSQAVGQGAVRRRSTSQRINDPGPQAVGQGATRRSLFRGNDFSVRYNPQPANRGVRTSRSISWTPIDPVKQRAEVLEKQFIRRTVSDDPNPADPDLSPTEKISNKQKAKDFVMKLISPKKKPPLPSPVSVTIFPKSSGIEKIVDEDEYPDFMDVYHTDPYADFMMVDFRLNYSKIPIIHVPGKHRKPDKYDIPDGFIPYDQRYRNPKELSTSRNDDIIHSQSYDRPSTSRNISRGKPQSYDSPSTSKNDNIPQSQSYDWPSTSRNDDESNLEKNVLRRSMSTDSETQSVRGKDTSPLIHQKKEKDEMKRTS